MNIDQGAKIIGGNGERIDSDFYPTPPEVTISLLKFIKENNHHFTSMSGRQIRVLEPCCGDGAISKVLMDYGFFVESHDIRFTEFAGSGIDYFSQQFKADMIITNPPFTLAQKVYREKFTRGRYSCNAFKNTILACFKKDGII